MAFLSRLQEVVTRKPPGLAATTSWLAVCVAVPTVARMALDPLLGSTLWFPTYYPAALIGVLFLGWRAGLVLMLLSALAANYFFVPPRHVLIPQLGNLPGMLVFLMADGVIVLATGLLRAALARLAAANAREKILNAELQHRMKNTLAVVQGLIAQTARREIDDPKRFQSVLQGRLEALADAHDLLSSAGWEGCDLGDLAARALAPFRDNGGITISGPARSLGAEGCVPLVLALHELATNAVKYGALSTATGTVDLSWSVAESGGATLLRWIERDGPAVKAPTRRGLGTRLLVRQPGIEEVRLRFEPEGVQCEILVAGRAVNPLNWSDTPRIDGDQAAIDRRPKG